MKLEIYLLFAKCNTYSLIRSGTVFELIATAKLHLADASDHSHTHDLKLVTSNMTSNNASSFIVSNQLPLFGHFCCRLAVQPDFIETNYCAGSLGLQSRGKTHGIDGYGQLRSFKIELWDNIRACENQTQPLRAIDITRDTKLMHKGELDFVVCNMEEGSIEKYVFYTKSLTETTNWYSAIMRAIKEHAAWDHVSLAPVMQLASPDNAKNYFLRSSRQGSLYDQVPISGEHCYNSVWITYHFYQSHSKQSFYSC